MTSFQVMVAVNGCEVVHCDSLVKEAMAAYWSTSKDLANRQGHFVRRSNRIETYLVSEAVDHQVKKQPKLYVMME